MKRLACILLVIVTYLYSGSYAHAQENSIESLLSKIELLPYKEAVRSIDQLIDNECFTSDSIKVALAKLCFVHFKNSNIMSSSALAVYIAENYFLNKRMPLQKEDFFEVQYYDTINKGTLLGHKAPPLALRDTLSNIHSLSELQGEYTIIYFYSDDCSYCKEETPKLMEFLDSYTHTPLNFYAVYIGSSSKAWRGYVNSEFSSLNPFVDRVDVADLKRDSDFPVKYGVVTTPALFLLDHAHNIIGRKLKTDNLREILENEHQRHLSYFKYFTRLFPENRTAAGGSKAAKATADTLYKNLTDRGLFNDMFRELYLYLSSSDFYPNQETAAYIGSKYIFENASAWDDSVFVNRVGEAVKLFNMNKLGDTATNVRLYDEANMPSDLLSQAPAVAKVLLFYKPGCGLCEEYVKALFSMRNKYAPQVEFTAVYTMQNYTEWLRYLWQNNLRWRNLWDKDGSAALGEKYDIGNVPSIYLLDSHNKVIAKDIEPKDLESYLKSLLKL